MIIYLRMGLVWVVASFLWGAVRLIGVSMFGVWTADGRMAVDSAWFGVIASLQIALTGFTSYMLMGLMGYYLRRRTHERLR